MLTNADACVCLMCSDTQAEIQLGGYDADAVDGKMFITPSITINDYVVVALSLRCVPLS